MSKTVIKVVEVSKRYSIGNNTKDNLRETLGSLFKRKKETDFWALKNVSFSVAQGDVLGIIGRNGAGKSTLLKILSKITFPTQGRVELIGRMASLLEVGTGFHHELTGRENIYLNGAILGMKKAEINTKIEEIIAFSEVEKFIDTPVKHYSSGMYVRLAFSVAAHLEPEILIVDEVLAVGDLAFQKKCLEKMSQVSQEGRTVIFVSHNLSVVKNFCTTGIYLNEGKIQKQGAIEEVVHTYLQEINNLVTQDIKHRTDRANGLSFKFTAVKIYDERGFPVQAIHCGSQVIFELHFKAQIKIEGLIFRIQFKNVEQQKLFILNTRFNNQFINIEAGVGKIQCTIEKFPLNVGSYVLDLRGETEEKIMDEIDNVTSFEVLKGNFFTRPILPPSSNSPFLADAQWKILR